jgi:hypothetical protein
MKKIDIEKNKCQTGHVIAKNKDTPAIQKLNISDGG